MENFIKEAGPVIAKFNELLVKYKIDNVKKNIAPIIYEDKLTIFLSEEITKKWLSK